jgi:hypothetical protein
VVTECNWELIIPHGVRRHIGDDPEEGEDGGAELGSRDVDI